MKVKVVYYVNNDNDNKGLLQCTKRVFNAENGDQVKCSGTLYNLLPNDIEKGELAALFSEVEFEDNDFEVVDTSIHDERPRVKTVEIRESGATTSSAVYMPRYRAEQLRDAVMHKHPTHVVVLTSEQ